MLGLRRTTGPGAPAAGGPGRRRGRSYVHDPDAQARPARFPRSLGWRRKPRTPVTYPRCAPSRPPVTAGHRDAAPIHDRRSRRRRDGRLGRRIRHPPRSGRRAVLLRARPARRRSRPGRRGAAGGCRRAAGAAPAGAGRPAAAGRLRASRAGAAGRRLLREPIAAHGPGRGDRDQRQAHDHLDVHRDLEDYYQAKRRLLTPAFTGVGIVNTDDPFGRRLAVEAAGAGIEVVTTGTARGAAWRAVDLEAALDGTRFRVEGPAGSRQLRLQLAGQFNVANALGALAAAAALGIDLDTAAAGLAGLAGVPGRFERVDEGQPFTVLVDYAHTPDSLENVLRAARAVTHGRVLVVFGCGGDRDRAKRPLMGEIAGKLADLAVVTSDNPRSEPPEAIVAQIVEGVRRSAGPDRYHVEVDRRAAIRHTLALARPGDAVLIAGKGHEQGQEFESGRKVPFDDRVVAAEELRALRSKGGAP